MKSCKIRPPKNPKHQNKKSSMYMCRSHHHFSSLAKPPRRVPSKYKSQALSQAQQAITDYLHATRSLPYTYAEHIAKNSTISIRNLISKLDFSAPTFSNSLHRYLRYHPINEFEFFFESIGIDYCDLGCFLPQKKFFFSEDRSVLDAAFALSGFGFPWNRLGSLYRQQVSIFSLSSEEITCRLRKFKGLGFSNFSVIDICLAFPHVLRSESDDEEVDDLFVNLKRIFVGFGFEEGVEGDDNVGCSWYKICRKIRVFFDLGCKSGEAWELIRRSKQLLVECPERVLIQKSEYICRFCVRKEDVGLLLLRRPEILDFDLETPVISVTGILKHFGLSKNEMQSAAENYPYVFGRNKMANLPHVMRVLNLHEWFFDKIKDGNHHLLTNYALSYPDEDLEQEYIESLEEIQNSRTAVHTVKKLDFLHGIGFGQNSLTLKVLKHVHGTSTELQDRFNSLLHTGIEFSKLCMLIRLAPKILNQKPEILEQKINFLCGEMGASLDCLDVFPAFLCFDLENRIKPRFRCHKWLMEKELCERSYSIASMVSTSEKAFVARLYGIHPAAPKHWFECFSYRKPTSSC